MTPYRIRLLAFGLGMPLLVSLVAGILMLSWAPDLPDPIAIHWSGSGPDGYGALWGNAALVLGIPLAFGAFSIGASWHPQPSGRPSATQKLLLATGGWLAGLLSVGIAGSVWMQRGLADASEAGDPLGWLGAGAVIGIVLGTIVWFALPSADNSSTAGRAAEPIAAATSERAAWSRTVRIARGLWALIAGSAVLAAAAVVITWVAAPRGVAFAGLALVAIVVLGLSTSSWRVTADARGLIVRSTFGWPRKRIPAEDIAAVQVVDVNPSADFGGWGWRWAPHGRRSGIVMRKGEAIEVTRRDGARFVVTVDDASTGAGVLAGVIARHAGT